jgi:hypothetical protein
MFTFFSPPLFDNTKHEPSTISRTIISMITKCWVIENTINNSSQRAIDIDLLIIPTRNQLRHDPLQDLGSNFSGWLIKDVGEVIF